MQFFATLFVCTQPKFFFLRIAYVKHSTNLYQLHLMKHFSNLLLVASFVFFIMVSCEKQASEPTYGIMAKTTTLGTVLTNQQGRTLYFFSSDVSGNSTCSGNCLTNWPVFYVDLTSVDPTLTATDFGTITRADGTKQTTFKGWPLYTYSGDAVAGDVKGENVGSKWYVAKTTYTIMLANAQLVGQDGKQYTSKYAEGAGDTQYFVDETGRTLYGFANDKKNKNNYTKSDFSNDGTWPIFGPDLKDIPSALDKSLFGTITVFGKNQMTYKGWPLYYFGSDNKVRGANKGVSVPKPGIWPIVNKDTPDAPL